MIKKTKTESFPQFSIFYLKAKIDSSKNDHSIFVTPLVLETTIKLVVSRSKSRFSTKQVLFKVSQISQENTCAGVLRQLCQKRDFDTGVFL